MATELNEGEICVKGNKYRIVNQIVSQDMGSQDMGSQDNMPYDIPQIDIVDTGKLATLIEKVDALVEVMGAGTTGGGYRSINLTLPPREQKYQVTIGLLANQIHIRADQGLIINMNSTHGEDIFVEIAEFPFSLSDLHKNESIHTLFFTTGANTTNIKILAIGMAN